MKSENNYSGAVVYMILKNGAGEDYSYVVQKYPTLQGAKIAKTRKWDPKGKRTGGKYYVADMNTYMRNKKVTFSERPNVITGKLMKIADGTPSCCDPTSEAYWSM